MSDRPSEEPDPDRLMALEKRLAEAKAARAPKARIDTKAEQANLAWRMVIEMVSGLGIGFGIGYGLDSLLGTMPILMVLFILLGFAAGVQTMMRTAKEFQTTGRPGGADKDKGSDGTAGRTGNTD